MLSSTNSRCSGVTIASTSMFRFLRATSPERAIIIPPMRALVKAVRTEVKVQAILTPTALVALLMEHKDTGSALLVSEKS